jgi:hypothetical protein
MDAVGPTHDQERNRLFVTLGLLTAGTTLAVVATRGTLLVSVPALVVVLVPFVAFSILLRVRRDTLGVEGRVVDLWSIPHTVGGFILGMFDVPFLAIAVLVTVWELVESVSKIYEHLANRIADVVLALAGWTLAQLLFDGSRVL